LSFFFHFELLVPSRSPLFPYTTLFRSSIDRGLALTRSHRSSRLIPEVGPRALRMPSNVSGLGNALAMKYSAISSNTSSPAHFRVDRKSTRLNSSHGSISYAVFCLKKKK